MNVTPKPPRGNRFDPYPPPFDWVLVRMMAVGSAIWAAVGVAVAGIIWLGL